jgi:hypothetical protein
MNPQTKAPTPRRSLRDPWGEAESDALPVHPVQRVASALYLVACAGVVAWAARQARNGVDVAEVLFFWLPLVLYTLGLADGARRARPRIEHRRVFPFVFLLTDAHALVGAASSWQLALDPRGGLDAWAFSAAFLGVLLGLAPGLLLAPFGRRLLALLGAAGFGTVWIVVLLGLAH